MDSVPFQAALYDELTALYPDSAQESPVCTSYRVTGANGETVGAHILLTGLTPGIPVSVEVEGEHTAFRLFELLPVPVEVNTGARQRTAYLHNDVNETVVRRAPFYIYEALKPMYNLLMPCGVTAALAFKTGVEYARVWREQQWEICIKHCGTKQQLQLTVERYPCTVEKPSRDTHHYVNWISYANVARYHGLDMDSPAYFRMLEQYLRAAVFSRQNTININLDMFFSLEEDAPVLNEERLSRYIQVCKNAGISIFQGSGFCGRAEGLADDDAFYQSLNHEEIQSPDEITKQFREKAFDLFDNGTRAVVGLGNADPMTKRGERLLRGQARLLFRYLQQHDLLGIWEQCLMDEPNDALAPVYRHISKVVHEEMPGVHTLEPVLPTHALTGSIDIWCPTNEGYEKDREYYDARVAAGDQLYIYTCLTPGGNYCNRMLDMPRIRQVYLGWGSAKYPQITGYLHWALNQYLDGVNPYERSCMMFAEQTLEFHPKRDMFLPAGDCCIFYPGMNTVYLSTRSEAQRIGLEDLCLLSRLPDAKREEIVAMVFRGYADYESDIAAYRTARKALLQAVCQAESTM